MDFIKQYVIPTILYDYTGNDIFDDFIWYTSFFMEIEGQSALEFADQIKKEAEFLFPASKGDSQAT